MMTGDIAGAIRSLEEALTADAGLAQAHEVLGVICFGAFDDYPRARRHVEIAYRLHRQRAELHDAARCAVLLAQVEGVAGNTPGMRGWLSRAKRLIDEIGTCLEEGYYEVARVGCEVPDVRQLQHSATRALELARQFGDTDLEVRALAESGLALLSLGRFNEGLQRLDEAVAAITAGEVRDLATNGLACCTVVSACDRLGDLDRLLRFREGLERLAAERFQGFQPPILLLHCRQAYGGLLGDAGRWQEAEAELRHAVELSHCAGHRASAMARLARLRIHQDRINEAAELLRGWEDRLEVAAVLAQLHDARGELDLAASTVRWALRQQESDVVSTAPLWSHLVDLELRRGHIDGASECCSRMEAIAEVLATPAVQAMALLSRGRMQRALGGDAESTLVAGLNCLRDPDRPLLRGEIHLELALVKRGDDPSGAITEARAGLALFERLGARRDAERAAAILRDLGVRVRIDVVTSDAMQQTGREAISAREREVLSLLAEGVSNAEIATRLFISPKTVEHHVSSILGKLGLRNRAEAAAWSAHQLAKPRLLS